MPESFGPGSDVNGSFVRFDGTASKYRLPVEIIAQARVELLEKAATTVAGEERIRTEDVEAIARVAKECGLKGHGTEGMKRAAGVINRRVFIEEWNPKDPPVVECQGLMLQDGEVCRWQEPARIYEQHSHREYIGGGQGISIPLGGGMRYHVGAFRGAPIDTAYLADCGDGVLHVTSQRICFAGSQASVSIPWRKIINISGFSDGLALHTTGARKPTIIQICEPELTVQIIGLAHSVLGD